MKKPTFPQNENVRLKALLDYQVLDTPPEPSYDDLTLLASSICKTPIALVSLIDTHRQWFKSRHGLGATETPRDVSFCGHAIHEKEVFEIKDSHLDPRFSDNPLVTGAPVVRFYAGAPLTTPEGLAIGTLCVIDHEPRELTPEQKGALEALARQVVHLLEMRKLAEKNKKAFDELKATSQTVLDQQQKLITAAKLSALGTMAGGIAHEINNPLAIIIAKSEQMAKRSHEKTLTPEYLAENLAKISQTGWRIQKIVSGLRSFSRDTSHDPVASVKLETLLADALGLCSEKIRGLGISFEVKGVQTGTLPCRAPEIGQVLVNLLGNATDAVKSLPTKWITLEIEESDLETTFKVTDSGKGIDPKVARHLMEPFFSTKAAGEGTGLGLSVSRGYVESHGGKLFYDPSCPNTRFVFSLPSFKALKLAKVA